MKIRVEISKANVAFIKEALRALHDSDPNSNSHGRLNLHRLAAMLLEDVALAIQRPGSWEGANMLRLLECHGYRL